MRFDSLPARDLPGGLRVLEASTHRTRALGLARLDDMPAGVALQITPCRSVHTFGMRFALDLIWLDRSGQVIRVDLDVAPRRLRSCVRARSVLEARAGAGEAFAGALGAFDHQPPPPALPGQSAADHDV
jgi:uncharacterized membrane protein (UPF0127 family)